MPRTGGVGNAGYAPVQPRFHGPFTGSEPVAVAASQHVRPFTRYRGGGQAALPVEGRLASVGGSWPAATHPSY